MICCFVCNIMDVIVIGRSALDLLCIDIHDNLCDLMYRLSDFLSLYVNILIWDVWIACCSDVHNKRWAVKIVQQYLRHNFDSLPPLVAFHRKMVSGVMLWNTWHIHTCPVLGMLLEVKRLVIPVKSKICNSAENVLTLN